jgi:hypothetical protein
MRVVDATRVIGAGRINASVDTARRALANVSAIVPTSVHAQDLGRTLTWVGRTVSGNSAFKNNVIDDNVAACGRFKVQTMVGDRFRRRSERASDCSTLGVKD